MANDLAKSVSFYVFLCLKHHFNIYFTKSYVLQFYTIFISEKKVWEDLAAMDAGKTKY